MDQVNHLNINPSFDRLTACHIASLPFQVFRISGIVRENIGRKYGSVLAAAAGITSQAPNHSLLLQFNENVMYNIIYSRESGRVTFLIGSIRIRPHCGSFRNFHAAKYVNGYLGKSTVLSLKASESSPHETQFSFPFNFISMADGNATSSTSPTIIADLYIRSSRQLSLVSCTSSTKLDYADQNVSQVFFSTISLLHFLTPDVDILERRHILAIIPIECIQLRKIQYIL